MNAHPDKELRIYPCGGHWHLTHKKVNNGSGKLREVKLKHQEAFKKLLDNNTNN